mmetsp:Transcript_125830/g.361845  ORF Transcript_125830/g.361845 Transcript_125830/m.361845 type:complete len:275 (-) Transcript_125830:1043-1867(-)
MPILPHMVKSSSNSSNNAGEANGKRSPFFITKARKASTQQRRDVIRRTSGVFMHRAYMLRCAHGWLASCPWTKSKEASRSKELSSVGDANTTMPMTISTIALFDGGTVHASATRARTGGGGRGRCIKLAPRKRRPPASAPSPSPSVVLLISAPPGPARRVQFPSIGTRHTAGTPQKQRSCQPQGAPSAPGATDDLISTNVACVVRPVSHSSSSRFDKACGPDMIEAFGLPSMYSLISLWVGGLPVSAAPAAGNVHRCTAWGSPSGHSASGMTCR